MTRYMTRFLLAAAVVLTAVGCDQNAFEEDFPDLEDGLPTYVSFDAVSIESDFSTSFDPDNAGQGLVIPVQQDAASTVALPVRLPTAVGEDVTVAYTLSGDAGLGTDFTIEGASGTQGQLVIPFDIDDAGTFSEDLEVAVNAAQAGDAPQSVTITLTGATSASGREYTIGRLPDGRDQSVTLQLNP